MLVSLTYGEKILSEISYYVTQFVNGFVKLIKRLWSPYWKKQVFCQIVIGIIIGVTDLLVTPMTISDSNYIIFMRLLEIFRNNIMKDKFLLLQYNDQTICLNFGRHSKVKWSTKPEGVHDA